MQTPSHFLLTAVLARKVPILNKTQANVSLLIGSILPDLPFMLLTVSYELYYRWFAIPPTNDSIMEYLHFDLFFNDPIWIISHNFFHSLAVNFVLLIVAYWGIRWEQRWARLLFWLTVGTLFHTVIDIFTHHSDGPLIFFPLNWHYRFPSPISYWESTYYGRPFSILEYTLDALIIIYLIRFWRR